MRSGKLDRTIRIDKFNAGAIDDYGTPGNSWDAMATVRAEIIQANTDEFIRLQGAVDEESVLFRIRYLADVTTADRIHYDGKNFNISQVTEIGRRKGLELRGTART